MKKAIIFLVLGLLLAGGGYVAWSGYYAAQTGADASFSISAKSNEPGYIELKPLTAPVVRDGAFAHYVLLVVNLEVTAGHDIADVREYMPRLRDAFVTELHALAVVRPRGQRLINLPRIKTRLLATAERVLGPGVVSEVLVQLAH